MKKFTLLVVAALMVATTGLAQAGKQAKSSRMLGQEPQMSAMVKKVPAKSLAQRQGDTSKSMAARWALTNAQKGKATEALARKKAVGDPVITDQPKGEYVNYVRSSDALYYYWGYIFQTQVAGAAGDVVFGSDGEVYFKNLITQYSCDSWTKGTINGNTIKIKFPQPALNYDGMEYDLFLGTYNEESWFTATPEATLTLNYDPTTGDITTIKGSDFETGAMQIGLCASDGSWAGYTDWNIRLAKMTDEPVAIPQGLESTTYSLSASGYAGSIVNVGFQGDDIYVQGIYNELPGAWVKGTISNGKAIFKTGQYLGSDGSYHQYLVSATAEELWDDWYEEWYTEYTLSDNDIVFDYDATTKTLSNSSCFLINAGKDEVYYSLAFNNATIAPFTETAATPTAPELTSYNYYGYSSHDYYGWWAFEFNIQTTDVDGNFILPEKLSYKFYGRVGDDVLPITLTANSYQNLDEDMDEVPYGFTDGWDIYAGAIYFYATGFDAIGMQTVYRGGGEEHASEISWLEVGEKQPEKETPDYPEVDPENTGASITFSQWDGQSDFSLFGEGFAMSYDVATKIEDASVVGTHIDKISFPLMNTEGVSGVKVWLSSNLRVEGGKIAPNLIEIPVEQLEAGFVSVTLDKPYTIPEGGVYVGYSLTIDDASIEANQKPIVILPGITTSGLYVHGSEMYVGWTDLTAETSASAYIDVEISGASVKADAAGLKDAENIYVKAGEPVNIKSTVVNHGANGISSLDIDYVLNGTTTSKHIDLAEPVSGIFGTSASIDTELPAIAERGTYDLTVTVTKVNGKDNGDVAAQTASQVIALTTVPKHRTLLEEYTGTWCGWCVRGYVALEKLAELYPDEYVLASYHNDDPMEIMSSNNYPSTVTGFPTSWMDRVAEVDPYYGYDYGVAPFTIVNALSDRAKVFGQADIQLEAGYDAEANTVEVAADVTFPYSLDNVSYNVEYLLIVDGLSGEEGSDWDQQNYYSGDNSGDANLQPFEQAEGSVPGLVFNDVVAYTSRMDWYADNAISGAVVADQPISQQYTISLDEAVNTSGAPVVQDTKKMKVVAILVNAATGEVVNANKVAVVDITTTGITNAGADSRQAETVIYDLMGRRINAPANGVYVKTVRMQNGETRSQKVLVK